jgi:hypothetical protein
MVLAILLKMVLMLVATLGMTAPAATATKPAIKAYSIKILPAIIPPNCHFTNQTVNPCHVLPFLE